MIVGQCAAVRGNPIPHHSCGRHKGVVISGCEHTPAGNRTHVKPTNFVEGLKGCDLLSVNAANHCSCAELATFSVVPLISLCRKGGIIAGTCQVLHDTTLSPQADGRGVGVAGRGRDTQISVCVCVWLWLRLAKPAECCVFWSTVCQSVSIKVICDSRCVQPSQAGNRARRVLGEGGGTGCVWALCVESHSPKAQQSVSIKFSSLQKTWCELRVTTLVAPALCCTGA